MQALEGVLGSLSLFAQLRPDERGRVARKFEIVELAAGTRRTFAATIEDARMLVVVRGTLRIESGALHAAVGQGDRWGDIELLTARPREIAILAERASVIALLDRAGLDAVLAEFPVVALPFATETPPPLDRTASYGILLLVALVAYVWRVIDIVLPGGRDILPPSAPGMWLALIGLIVFARGVFEIHDASRPRW